MSASPIEETWRRAWRPPDRRPIYETVGEHLTLGAESPYRGRFDINNSPQIRAPLDALRDDAVRMVSISGSAQSAKTLGALLFILDCLTGSAPGNTQWNSPTEPAARKMAEGKFWKLARRFQPFLDRLPANPDKVRTLGVDFEDAQFVIQTASENNAHGDSVRYQVNDDLQQWTPGMWKKYNDRTTAFARSRKILNTMTGMERHHEERLEDGTVVTQGDDAHDVWHHGTREIWHVPCPACDFLQPLAWRHSDARGATLRDAAGRPVFGFVFDENQRTRPGGRWNLDAVAATARWRCLECAHEIPASIPNIRALADAGSYVATNPSAPSWHRSFRYPAMVTELVGWGLLVQEWVSALDAMRAGNSEPLRIFTKNRLAEPWFDGYESQGETKASGDYQLGDPWLDEDDEPLEDRRYLTVDTQRGTDNQIYFKVLGRAWARGGRSRLVHYGQESTFEAVRALQIRLGIADDRRVLVDTGDGEHTTEIYEACVRYGWTGLKGDKAAAFPHPNPRKTGETIMRPWSLPFRGDPGVRDARGRRPAGRPSRRKGAQRAPTGKAARCFHWSNFMVKNMLARLRDGEGLYWGRPTDEPEEYKDGLFSEVKVSELDKLGARRWRWVKTKKNNHPWDLEAAQVVAALMSGLIESRAEASAVGTEPPAE